MNVQEAEDLNAQIATFLAADTFDMSELVKQYPSDTSAQRQFVMLLALRTGKEVEGIGGQIKAHIDDFEDFKSKRFRKTEIITSLLLSVAIMFFAQQYDIDLIYSIVIGLLGGIIPNGKSLAGAIFKLPVS